MKYMCKLCGWIYDEEVEGTLFTDLEEEWACPACGAPKSEFESYDE